MDLGLLAGTGWAAGINVYAVTLILGVAGRLGWAEIPDVLQRTDVMVVAGILFGVEFVADKVPYIDNIWDGIHTVVRPLGAAALGAVLAGEFTDIGSALGALITGVLAVSSHSTKATTRAAVNTSPEPVSNIALSVFEDGLVGGVMLLAIEFLIIAIVVVALLVIFGIWLTVKLWRAFLRLREKWKAAGKRLGAPPD
ncbi:MAG: DUF4126 family protein [Acidimicrobiia bacterium]|nr:DUF4126 family protein [Acidimicrobiia bacterium]